MSERVREKGTAHMPPPFQELSWREIAQKGPSLHLEVSERERERWNEHMAGALAPTRMHQRERESNSGTNLGL